MLACLRRLFCREPAGCRLCLRHSAAHLSSITVHAPYVVCRTFLTTPIPVFPLFSTMVSLKIQKRLAASVLNCGKGKVWLDPNEATAIGKGTSRTSPLLVYHHSPFPTSLATHPGTLWALWRSYPAPPHRVYRRRPSHP